MAPMAKYTATPGSPVLEALMAPVFPSTVKVAVATLSAFSMRIVCLPLSLPYGKQSGLRRPALDFRKEKSTEDRSLRCFLELLGGFEPPTSSLPRMRSTY